MADGTEPVPAASVPWEILDQEFPDQVPQGLPGREIIERAFQLGVAIGAASMRAEQERPATDFEPVPSYPQYADLLERLRGLPGVKIIGDIPVTTYAEITQYGSTELGLTMNHTGARLWNALAGNKDRDVAKLSGTARRVSEATHFYDAQEQPTPAGDTALYLDMFGVLGVTKEILLVWRQTNKLETSVRNLGEGLFKYLVGFLNHKLQLDPPLKLPE